MTSSGNQGSIEFKRLEQDELDHLLRAHAAFLEGGSGGLRAQLAFHDLSNLDLNDRNLRDIDFSGTKLRQATLKGAQLISANLFAADLSVASLDGADLTRADLRGACFRGAVLTDAAMTEADLREGVLAKYDAQRDLEVVTFGATPAELTTVLAARADLSGAKL